MTERATKFFVTLVLSSLFFSRHAVLTLVFPCSRVKMMEKKLLSFQYSIQMGDVDEESGARMIPHKTLSKYSLHLLQSYKSS